MPPAKSKQSNIKISSLALLAMLSISLVLSGCKASSEFNEDVAKDAIEGRPLTLEGEQVVLSDSQLQCGIQSELWEAPTSSDQTAAHITAKARDLKFNDDVILHDASIKVPYVQIRGTFPIQVDSISSTKDGEDSVSKLVEAKARVKIDNPCFPQALPLMGVRHGNFNVDTPVVFHLHFDDSGWHADKIVH